MDLHHNLFYGYRGPSEFDADRDPQLENNLTKALINTLSLCGEEVWRPFLEDLGLLRVSPPMFLLQRKGLPSVAACEKKQRVLLGISKERTKWILDPAEVPVYVSVPDAWIYGDGYAVLVESKTNGDFAQSQMCAHYACLRRDDEPARIVTRTWSDLHALFSSLQRSIAACASKLLVSQFVQFLEYTGMAEFCGFRLDHFNYFLLREDPDARRWVKEQMQSFGSMLQRRLAGIDAFYAEYEVGNLKSDDPFCWIAFGPRGYRDATHQTIALGSNGLRVFINSELRRATDRLKAVLRSDEVNFKSALCRAHEFRPFTLVLQERVQRQAQIYDYHDRLTLASTMLVDSRSDSAWRGFVETVLQFPFPYLRIERTIPAQQLLQLSGPEAALGVVTGLMEENHKIVQHLNGSVR